MKGRVTGGVRGYLDGVRGHLDAEEGINGFADVSVSVIAFLCV